MSGDQDGAVHLVFLFVFFQAVRGVPTLRVVQDGLGMECRVKVLGGS